MPLSRLIYHSEAVDGADTGAILAVSKRNNALAGISGALLDVEPYYVQVLEGGRKALGDTFLRIARDPRHRAVTLCEFVEVERRVFPAWDMCDLTGREVQPELVLAHGPTRQFDPRHMPASSLLAFVREVYGEALRAAKSASPAD